MTAWGEAVPNLGYAGTPAWGNIFLPSLVELVELVVESVGDDLWEFFVFLVEEVVEGADVDPPEMLPLPPKWLLELLLVIFGGSHSSDKL